MLPLALLAILVPFSSPLTLEEIWHKKWLKSKLTTTPSPLYRPGIIQHRLKEGKETKQEGKTRKESTTATTRKESTTATTAPESFCSTAGCVRAAAELLQKMDQTVDPCQVLLMFLLALALWINLSILVKFFGFSFASTEKLLCLLLVVNLDVTSFSLSGLPPVCLWRFSEGCDSSTRTFHVFPHRQQDRHPGWFPMRIGYGTSNCLQHSYWCYDASGAGAWDS